MLSCFTLQLVLYYHHNYYGFSCQYQSGSQIDSWAKKNYEHCKGLIISSEQIILVNFISFKKDSYKIQKREKL